jgi:hypothetical protein
LVSISICGARTVTGALFCAFVKGSVPDIHELIRCFHATQGRETTSTTTYQLLLSPAPLGEVNTIRLEPTEAVAFWNRFSAIAVAKRATIGVAVTTKIGLLNENLPRR